MAGNKVSKSDIFKDGDALFDGFAKSVKDAEIAVAALSTTIDAQKVRLGVLNDLLKQSAATGLNDSKAIKTNSQLRKESAIATKAIEQAEQAEIATKIKLISLQKAQSEAAKRVTKDTEAQQKAQEKATKATIAAAEAERKKASAYEQSKIKLNQLAIALKDQSIKQTVSNSQLRKDQAEFDRLHKSVTRAEQGVKQFTRNVGNYPKTFFNEIRNLANNIPGFGGLIAGAEAAAASIGAIGLAGAAVIAPLAAATAAFLRTTEGAETLNIVTKEVTGGFYGLLKAFLPGSGFFGNFNTSILVGIERGKLLAKVENEIAREAAGLTKAIGEQNTVLAINAQIAGSQLNSFEERRSSLLAVIASTEKLDKLEQQRLRNERKAAENSLEDNQAKKQLAINQAQAALDLNAAKALTNERQLKLQLLALDNERASIEGDLDVEKQMQLGKLQAAQAAQTNRLFAERLGLLQKSQKNENAGLKDNIADSQARLDNAQALTDEGLKSEIVLKESIILEQAKSALKIKEINDDQAILELKISHFKIESATIKDIANLKQKGFAADIANDKKTFEARFEALNKFRELNRETLGKQSAVAVETFGPGVDLAKLAQSPDLQADLVKISGDKKAQAAIRAAVLEYIATLEEAKVKADALNDAQIKNLAIITELYKKLSVENITALHKDKQTAEQFIQARIDLEAQQSIALENIRHESENKKINETVAANATNLILLTAALAAQREEQIKHENELRLIAIKEVQSRAERAENIADVETEAQKLGVLQTIRGKENQEKALADIEIRALQDRIDRESDTINKLRQLGLETFAAEKQLILDKEELIRLEESKRLKRDTKILESAQRITSLVGEELQRRADLENKFLDNDIEKRKDNVDQQLQLAVAGKDNQLAFEKEQLAKAELAQKEALQRQARQQEAVKLAEAFLSNLNQKLSAGESYGQAAAESIAEIFAAKAIAATIAGSFFEGTEKVQDDLKGNKVHSGRDGYHIAVDGKERILTGDQNAAIGNMSNEELAKLAADYQAGRLLPNYAIEIPTPPKSFAENITNSLLIAEIKDLKQQHGKLLKAIADKPSYGPTEFDRWGRAIITKYENGIKEKDYVKSKPNLRGGN